MEQQILLKRLAIIKYLASTASSQSLKPEPLNSLAILLYHDSVELFLDLVADKLNIKHENFSFIDYWEETKPKLQQLNKSELTQKETMRKLNKSRVSLKHHGTLPSKMNIDEYRLIVNIFLKENTSNVFDLNFETVSLVDLIAYEKSKEYLKKAKKCRGKNQTEAAKNLVYSFKFLIREYIGNKKLFSTKSPFYFGRDMIYSNLSEMGMPDVEESINLMQQALEIMSLGIDYRKYSHFSFLTPNSGWIAGKEELYFDLMNNYDLSLEDFDFCYEFVIESVLKLQDFEFEIKERNEDQYTFDEWL